MKQPMATSPPCMVTMILLTTLTIASLVDLHFWYPNYFGNNWFLNPTKEISWLQTTSKLLKWKRAMRWDLRTAIIWHLLKCLGLLPLENMALKGVRSQCFTFLPVCLRNSGKWAIYYIHRSVVCQCYFQVESFLNKDQTCLLLWLKFRFSIAFTHFSLLAPSIKI